MTLGDEEARRRRTQKTVLERKAPPTFDVIVEIQDRDRVAVHGDVAETIDAMLRGDALAPEMRWRDEGGVHRSQARPRPGPRSAHPRRALRWPRRCRASAASATEPACAAIAAAPAAEAYGRAGAAPRGRSRRGRGIEGWPGDETRRRAGGGAVFRAGAIADRGPHGARHRRQPEPRARDARELERQAEWRASANRAMTELMADEAEAAGRLRAPAHDAVARHWRSSRAPGQRWPGHRRRARRRGRVARDEEESLIRLSRA